MNTKNSKRVYKTIMLIIITSMLTFLLTTIMMYGKFKNTFAISNKSSNTLIEESGLLSTLQEFKAILKSEYIGEIDEEKMLEGAAKGYVNGLGDAYTQYLTVEDMQELREDTDGRYVGIGVYVTTDTKTDSILIIGVFKGSPALEAGIQAGDIIKKVNGVEYLGSQLSDAVAILKGGEGTEVTVTILRDDQEIEFNIVRKTINVEHIAYEMLEDGIGYIEMDSFNENISKDFENSFNSLKENDMKGLIIDLRDNGGGVVKEATEIASMFAKKGDTILITKNKKEDEKKTISNRDPIVENLSIVVLVNEATASASEILAGALKDNYGVTIIGKNTYGKGIIQSVYALSDGSGLKVTTDEYFTPNHTQINSVGIKPDIEVDLSKDEYGIYQTDKENDKQLLKAIEVLKEKID